MGGTGSGSGASVGGYGTAGSNSMTVTGGGTGTLPQTGNDFVTPVAAGALLVGLGSAVLLYRRRRATVI
jgi:LPXTG-motif cell wall-anchored protein